MRLSKWHTLVAGLQAALITGFIYTYSTYSNSLQVALNLTESDKETIGMAPPIGSLLTWTTGLIMDRTDVRFCCCLGGMIMAISYATFGLVGMRVFTLRNPVPLCFALGAAANYGASFITAAVFSTLGKKFTTHRSAVVSVAKSWAGVSAAVTSSIYIGLFPDDEGAPASRLRFLFFAAALSFAVPAVVCGALKTTADADDSLDHMAIPLSWRLRV